MNFLDLLYDKDLKTPDGKLYCPQLFKKLVNDCYIISKFIHTSYNELLQLSVIEKNYLLDFIKQDKEQESKQIQENIQNMKNRNNK